MKNEVPVFGSHPKRRPAQRKFAQMNLFCFVGRTERKRASQKGEGCSGIWARLLNLTFIQGQHETRSGSTH